MRILIVFLLAALPLFLEPSFRDRAVLRAESETPARLKAEGAEPLTAGEAKSGAGGSPEAKSTRDSEMSAAKIKISVGSVVMTASMADNSSVRALLELLADGPLVISMHDYGHMEKVGGLGVNLPRNDEQITTRPGDLILYQGNKFVIYYAENSWNFTRLGKINDVTKDELMGILGSGAVTVTLSR